ncbi:MAG: Re/Si-specific NAD(P)(+) transhydrogenase subunit alpha [Acidobacteria bacterium]|nr:Re/Si-specific NAD(P)(+) transhydrogenase subunit alpha [Acidobacteriota bacterium]
MKVFIPKETRSGEQRVSGTPETVKKLTSAGFTVSVEKGAGLSAHISDAEFETAGAQLTDVSGYKESDLCLKINPPEVEHAKMLKEGSILICALIPHAELDVIKILQSRKISTFSTNLIPRITIAQKMDTLSSQASIAGYKAVIKAADHLGKYYPLLMTAAGTIHPAKVVILGAGVAGLMAIATARRLGAQVEAFDVRAAVKEQVESLGAKFIEVEPDADMEDAGGYAKQASEAFLARQRAEIAKRVAAADVVVTTALVPGKKAPVLITTDTVKQMRSGSVIVDLAVEQGGNCELTQMGTHVVEGVTIIGDPHLASNTSIHASQLFARNLWNMIEHLSKDGEMLINLEEPITDGSLLTYNGTIRHEPTRTLMEQGG